MLKFILGDYKIGRYITESVPKPPLVAIFGSTEYTAESLKAVEDWEAHRRYILQLMIRSTLSVRDHLEQYGFRYDEEDPYVIAVRGADNPVHDVGILLVVPEAILLQVITH
ncbi:hypothetical protein SEPCBS57363_003251 [Sporothrix epigloea]|uniref:Uncharacterized protein n=1 Tax=Sporothrix epigloea TaxID=1892477 RepID=A0ABP0DME9_9PEZI